MLDKLKSLAQKAMETVSSKVDEEDVQTAAKWAKETVMSVYDEASRLGKEAVRSDLAKDAASGAAIGAVVAIPVPIIGPMAGATIGAGLGVYKNFTKKNQPALPINHQTVPKDIYAELLKLDDLKQKNIISEVEFETQKKKILNTT